MNISLFADYPDVLNIEQVRTALNIGKNAAYDLIRNRQLRYFKVGTSIRIPKQCLIDFVIDECYNDNLTNGQSVQHKEVRV